MNSLQMDSSQNFFNVKKEKKKEKKKKKRDKLNVH